MNYKRLFYNWLRKENIYCEFFSNVMTHSHITRKYNSGKRLFEYITHILNKYPETYISSFIWADTHQGRKFWSKKCFEWNIYLDKWKRTH